MIHVRQYQQLMVIPTDLAQNLFQADSQEVVLAANTPQRDKLRMAHKEDLGEAETNQPVSSQNHST